MLPLNTFFFSFSLQNSLARIRFFNFLLASFFYLMEKKHSTNILCILREKNNIEHSRFNIGWGAKKRKNEVQSVHICSQILESIAKLWVSFRWKMYKRRQRQPTRQCICSWASTVWYDIENRTETAKLDGKSNVENKFFIIYYLVLLFFVCRPTFVVGGGIFSIVLKLLIVIATKDPRSCCMKNSYHSFYLFGVSLLIVLFPPPLWLCFYRFLLL